MLETKQKKTNYQYLLQTRKFLLVSIGLAAVCAFVALTILFPNVSKVTTLSANIKKEQRKLDNLQKKKDILQNVSSTDLYGKKDKINAILPSTKPLLQLLNQIDRVSSENQVIISEFGLVPGQISTDSAKEKTTKKSPTQNANVDSIETKIVVVGTINRINAFLKEINFIAPLTQITELSLKGINRKDLVEQQTAGESVFEATLTLSTSFFVGKVQADPAKSLPDVKTFTNEQSSELDQFKVGVSSQLPLNPVLNPDGKKDLFQ